MEVQKREKRKKTFKHYERNKENKHRGYRGSNHPTSTLALDGPKSDVGYCGSCRPGIGERLLYQNSHLGVLFAGAFDGVCADR
jgi:hypothetical protein